MNKHKEAYLYIKYLIELDEECVRWPLYQKSIKTFKELVDKATPKKPIKRKENDIVMGSYIAYDCPCCKQEQVLIFKKENKIAGFKARYCHKCGQALDWEQL